MDPFPTRDPLEAGLRMIAHDLRNAATVVTGVVEELQSHAETNPDLSELATILAQALGKLQHNGEELVRLRRLLPRRD